MLPWEKEGAAEHVKNRQPVMEIKSGRGVRQDLPVRRCADRMPRCLETPSYGAVVMTHRGSSNGRLSVLLSSIPANWPVMVSSDSVADEDVAGDEVVSRHHGAEFSHMAEWGGRAKHAVRCMDVTDWDLTLFLCDDVWLFPEALRNSLMWWHAIVNQGVPMAQLGFPGWETYREHKRWGFDSWGQCLAEPWRFESVPPNEAFSRCPSLWKNPFGACMLMSRAAYRDLGGFDLRYWAHDDVYNHKVWLSDRWVNCAFPGRGYMHLGAQSWHHGEAQEYVNQFQDATGMPAQASGALQAASMFRWKATLGPHFTALGGECYNG